MQSIYSLHPSFKIHTHKYMHVHMYHMDRRVEECNVNRKKRKGQVYLGTDSVHNSHV